MNDLTFNAEIIEVKSKKTASLDVVHRLILQTDDNDVIALAALDGDTMLKITIEVVNG